MTEDRMASVEGTDEQWEEHEVARESGVAMEMELQMWHHHDGDLVQMGVPATDPSLELDRGLDRQGYMRGSHVCDRCGGEVTFLFGVKMRPMYQSASGSEARIAQEEIG